MLSLHTYVVLLPQSQLCRAQCIVAFSGGPWSTVYIMATGAVLKVKTPIFVGEVKAV